MTKKALVQHLIRNHGWGFAGVGYNRTTKAHYAEMHDEFHAHVVGYNHVQPATFAGMLALDEPDHQHEEKS